MGTEVADQLRSNYTVLELETFTTGDQPVTAFCVVNEVPVSELPMLEYNKQVHADFIREFNQGNFNNCVVIAEGLRGKFNGELDSFYEIILDRINNTLK
jgi:hypothetical protein